MIESEPPMIEQLDHIFAFPTGTQTRDMLTFIFHFLVMNESDNLSRENLGFNLGLCEREPAHLGVCRAITIDGKREQESTLCTSPDPPKPSDELYLRSDRLPQTHCVEKSGKVPVI
jgi:hypothetical protein